MNTLKILMTILLTIVSQICSAQTGTFGAPSSRQQLTEAKANANKFGLLLNVADQISLNGVNPCTNGLWF